MNHPPENDWSIPQRQSSLGLVIIVYKAGITILKAIWPIVLVALFRQKKGNFDTIELLLIIIPLLILIKSVLDFYYYKFYITGNDLVIKKGFISKKTITLPINRIQAVHIDRSVLHQLLNVASLKVDTAGSEKTEATIEAISVPKAESLKSFLLDSLPDQIAGEVVRAPGETVVMKLSPADVVKLGISANHIQTFFIVIAFGISMLQNLEEIFGNKLTNFVNESSSTIIYSVRAFLLIAIAGLLVSVVVSIFRIVLLYFDFKLYKTAQGFKLKTGLLHSRQNVVPFSKIQFISWSANLFRRSIGLYNLEFHQAGGDIVSRKQKVKIPLTNKLYIDGIIAHYHPDFRDFADSVHHINSIYPFRRMLLPGIPVAIFFTLTGYFWLHWYSIIFLLFLPYFFLSGLWFQKNFRLFISVDAMQLLSGVWGREIKIVKWRKIQIVDLRQSIYQRSAGLATIKLITAAGSITVPYISLSLAETIRNYALYKVESSNEPWM